MHFLGDLLDQPHARCAVSTIEVEDDFVEGRVNDWACVLPDEVRVREGRGITGQCATWTSSVGSSKSMEIVKPTFLERVVDSVATDATENRLVAVRLRTFGSTV